MQLKHALICDLNLQFQLKNSKMGKSLNFYFWFNVWFDVWFDVWFIG